MTQDAVPLMNLVGAELARENGGTSNINVAIFTAIASKLDSNRG
jgi:hypothetical protein